MILASPALKQAVSPVNGISIPARIAASPFCQIKSLEEFAEYLGITTKKLSYLLYVLPDKEKYEVFEIPKKSGSTRIIAAPHVAIKRLQKSVANALLDIYGDKDGVHGYVKNKSIISNAKSHLRKRYLLNVDLKDFFPTINFGRVRGLFLTHPFNFPEPVATAIARLCTYDNCLPSGAPTSPIISNFICWGLDSYLRKLCFRLGCTYTRYADDIAISTNRENFPAAIATITHDPFNAIISDDVKKIIEKNGFVINDEKTRFATNRQSQVVTGIKVNELLNVNRDYIRQLRSMLHSWEKFGLEKAENEYRSKYHKKARAPFRTEVSFKQVVHGKLTFLRSVRGANDEIYQKLLGRYSLVADLKHLTICGFPKQINRALWILESHNHDDDYYQGTGFDLDGIGVITCAHVLKPHTKARRIYNHRESLDIRILERNDLLDYAIIQVIGAEDEVNLIPEFEFEHSVQTPIRTIGFPAHDEHATVAVEDGAITQVRRNRDGNRWLRVNTNIVAGNSGGPVLNKQMKVIGIVAYGATSLAAGGDAINNGYIPIDCLNHSIIE
jgi:RNA-directed DNA polymerase